MDRDFVDHDFLLLGSILLIDWDSLHLLQSTSFLRTLNDATKNGILAVQVRCLLQGDEELTPVGFGALVRHRHHATPRVSQRRNLDFVFEILAPDGCAALYDRMVRNRLMRRLGCVAALNHKIGDQAMERRAIIGS